MTRTAVYLDYNATAPAAPGVARAMADAVALGGNASSVHAKGRAARRLIDGVRGKVALAVGSKPANVIFTSGGTEANRLALTASGKPRVLASAVEHPAVTAYCPPGNLLPVDADGRLDLQALRAALAQDGAGAIVSLMLANNETGVLQPVAEAAAIAHAAGAILHCDAVQGFGKMPVDMAALGVDLLTVSAHKVGGPAGVGALVLANGLLLSSTRAAGGQEQGRRSGTENLAGIAGFGAALDHLGGMLADCDRQSVLRKGLEAALRPDAVVFGQDAPRLANTVCIAMPGVAAETQVMAFDLAGFCVSAGAACSSGKVQASPVLLAMGVAPELAATAIRVSFGSGTTVEEIDAFAAQWKLLYGRRQAA